MPTRYKILCSINKQYHVRIYVQREAVYIYHLGVRSVLIYIYTLSQAIITRKVSAVTVYPLFKASSCELSNSSKNIEEKK
jgi:hypothetical protein